MRYYFLIVGLIVMVGFSGCESQQRIAITCTDRISGEPLSGVHIEVNAGLDGDYTKSTASGETDESGYFETDIMIGCPGKCYDIYITYTKSGYETRKDLNQTEGTVELNPLP